MALKSGEVQDQPYQDKALQKFGAMVQRLRKRRKWSQEVLADEIGVDRCYISFLERGLRNPTLKTIVEISALFETDLIFAGKSLIQ